MSAIFQSITTNSIHEAIQNNSAWLGHVSGLKAEKMLRGKKTPFLYVLRAGEHENDYYVTFVTHDFSIRHTPFTLTHSPEGWSYENTCGGGIYAQASIDDVIHLIMHCNKEACTPYIVQ